MKEFIIGKNDANQRLNKFIAKIAPALSGGMMHKYIRTKRIKLNGKRTEASQKLEEGDVLSLYINDEFFPEEKSGERVFSKKPVNIAYEDDDIIIANKPAGLLCHDGDTPGEDTLVSRIAYYLYSKGEYTPENENAFAPTLANRIDRNTSGLVLAAKNAAALKELNEIVRERLIEKKYRLIVLGAMKPENGVLKNTLKKDADANIVRSYLYQSDMPGGLTAITHYKVYGTKKTEKFGLLSLIEARIETGRTHQIRAQFAAAGSPLLGDGKYGRGRARGGWQALCAYSLKFNLSDYDGSLKRLNGKRIVLEPCPIDEEFASL